MNLDMTKGSPLKLILKFLFPVLLGNLFQQFYNMADTIIVGRFVGPQALAAVGATGTISFFILGFMMGITTGFTVLTAQRFGAGDYEGVRKSVGNAFVLSAVVTVIMTVLSVAGMDWILEIMQTPDDIFEMSKSYITIICGGLVFTILYNLAASVLRAVGNSRVPLYFLILSATLNIILDLVFIIVFHWGVAGAAAATVISQGVSGFLCLIYLLTKIDFLKLKKEHFALDRNGAMNQIRIGVPMALQFSITAIGTMMVQAALNMLGSTIVAAYTAACKVEQLVTTAFQAMGATMATYSAQNWGVHSVDRLRRGSKTAVAISCIYSIVIYGVVNLILPYATALFFDGDITEVIGYVRTYIMICGIFFIPLGLIFIYRNLLQGCGYTLIPTLGGVVELVSRGIFAFLAAQAHSYTGVCIANASAWCTAGIYLWIAYLFIMRGIIRKDEEKKELHQRVNEMI
ncbi:MAG: MATE family efflux transporter [Lachnospiraceae bacterium]|nr:MATE family efflux transporter [Lachnospiraceae bacterium]